MSTDIFGRPKVETKKINYEELKPYLEPVPVDHNGQPLIVPPEEQTRRINVALQRMENEKKYAEEKKATQN